MSAITLGAINAPSGGTFTLPSNTLLNGAALTSATMTNPTVTVGTVSSGGTTTTSQTVNILSSSTKPRLSSNAGTNIMKFQLSTTPTSAGTQIIQFALPSRTTAIAAISDVAGPRPNGKDAASNPINDIIIGGVVGSSGSPSTSGFVQFTANSTTSLHTIDLQLEYIS